MVCGATSMIDWPVRSGAANGFAALSVGGAASGTDTSKVEPAPGWLSSVMRPPMRLTMRSLMLEPEAGAAIVAGDALVGLLEFAENALLRLGRDADAGVAHQETDFVGPDAGLDDQRHAAGRGELDRVAGEIEQHLPQPRGVADHLHRQPLVDIGRDLELARPARAAPAIR